jgi:hypothetical protein
MSDWTGRWECGSCGCHHDTLYDAAVCCHYDAQGYRMSTPGGVPVWMSGPSEAPALTVFQEALPQAIVNVAEHGSADGEHLVGKMVYCADCEESWGCCNGECSPGCCSGCTCGSNDEESVDWEYGVRYDSTLNLRGKAVVQAITQSKMGSVTPVAPTAAPTEKKVAEPRGLSLEDMLLSD